MKAYNISATRKTPAIIFDPNIGVLDIKGRSTPEDALTFYTPLFDSLAIYATNFRPITTVNIYVEYLLTSSAKCILEVFKMLAVINKKGSAVTINWYYEEEDDDMQETGKDFQRLIDVPFKIIMVRQIS
ncbi:MAG: DUF1987 domain-containing protein [Bacteroidota bacterium]